MKLAARASVHSLLLILLLVNATDGIAAEQCAGPANGSGDGVWKAGVARVVITPEQPMRLIGYGNMERFSKGKLHDLWVKALALEDPRGTRMLLVTADLVGIDKLLSDAICEELVGSLKLPRESIVIATSHTHTGPLPTSQKAATLLGLSAEESAKIDAYVASLQRAFVRVAQEALAALVPARVAWGNGSTDFAVNRRENPPEANVAELRAAGKFKGPEDHQVPVLRVSGPDGKLRAAVFGYACHNTAAGGSSLWGGDYAGFSQIELEKTHPGAVALFFSGCGGDQEPRPRSTVELAARHGRTLADAVEQVLKSDMRPVSGRLEARFAIVDLPYESLPTQKELEERARRGNRSARLQLEQIKEKGALSPTYPYPVQVWKLGADLTLVALAGEPVVDYSLRLKKELGPDGTWVAGYCNDIMAYIPSLRVLREGGYEGKNSMFSNGHPSVWGPQVEELIVAKVHELAGR